MSIEVFVANEQSDREVDCDRWVALAEATLAAERVPDDSELSVLFVDEQAIAALNKRFLGHEGPTDVLSFPIEDSFVLSGRYPDNGGNAPGWEPPEDDAMPSLLGDVVICPEVAWRNAPEHAGTYDDELALLLVHGILHLLGMDHELAEEAEEMETRERELLAAFHRPPGGLLGGASAASEAPAAPAAPETPPEAAPPESAP